MCQVTKKQCFTKHIYIHIYIHMYVLQNTVWYWNVWYFIKNTDEKITDKAKQSNKSSPQQELFHFHNYTPQGTKLSTGKPLWLTQCQQICAQTKKQQDTTNIQQFIYWKQRNTYT